MPDVVTNLSDGRISFKRAGAVAQNTPQIPDAIVSLIERGKVDSQDQGGKLKVKSDVNAVLTVDRDSPEAKSFHMEPIESSFTENSGDVLIRAMQDDGRPEQTRSRQIAFTLNEAGGEPQNEFSKEILSMVDRVARLKAPEQPAEQKSFKVQKFEFAYQGESLPGLKSKMNTDGCVVGRVSDDSFGFDLRGTRNSTHYNAQVEAVSESQAKLTVSHGETKYEYQVTIPNITSPTMKNRECSFVTNIRTIVEAQMEARTKDAA